MHLEFLGTGDSGTVPLFGCDCLLCHAAATDPRLCRNPSCARLSTGEQTLLIDCGIGDIGRRIPRRALDRILISHYHIDHLYGLFTLRWGTCSPLPVHGPVDQEGCADLFKHPGILDFSEPMTPFATRQFGDMEVTPLPLNHSKATIGFGISSGDSRLAWLSDTCGLPRATTEFLISYRPDVMVLDCTFPPGKTTPQNHNDLTMAGELHLVIRPARTYLTHINHDFARWLFDDATQLPSGMRAGYDGLNLEL